MRAGRHSSSREGQRVLTQEEQRLEASQHRSAHWKRWGPYLSERAWGTVREDYSLYGNAWNHFPHDHARSKTYRWGEDGIGGICDRHQAICFAVALWNGRDPLLKERLFGLTGSEGNHGEDVKEYYFYLDSTPTHSYMKFLYKYPQSAYPYAPLVEENRRRSRQESLATDKADDLDVDDDDDHAFLTSLTGEGVPLQPPPARAEDRGPTTTVPRPSRFLMRPTLLTRSHPLPVGRDIA